MRSNPRKKQVKESLPDVAVLIPARNAARTIGRAITSISLYTNLDVAFYIGDDGSEDYTADTAKQAMGNISILYNDERLGVSATLNNLLQVAKGRYMYVTDADDRTEPYALDALVKAADSVKDRDHRFFYGHTLYHYENGSTSYHKQKPAISVDAFYKFNPVCSDILVPFTDEVKRIQFIEDKVHEDWAYMLSLIERGFTPTPVDTLVLHYYHTNHGNYSEMGYDATVNMRKYFKMRA